ncbi:hypothetical protein RJ55_07582 [Drechmeria coniospora]|nr:hypothetical protein RJ55_07582 [Drechmeria coniospora]
MRIISLLAAVAMALVNPVSGLPGGAATPKCPAPAHHQPVTHIVMFQFKNGTRDVANTLASKFFALKDTCILPTGEPYIEALTGGKDNSNENIQGGVGNTDKITDVFVAKFRSVEDRDYYVDKDPVHEVFKNYVGTLINNGTLVGKKVQVVDYTPGVF